MCKQAYLIRNPRAGIFGQREFLPVPCGKCTKCRITRIQTWQFRLQQEIKVSHSAQFVTLTYDQNNVPISNVLYEKGYPDRNDNKAHVQKVLKSRDVTLFLKRLRHKTPNIRYFYVGEYGTLRHRPHYHIILLNCDEPRTILDTWTLGHVDIRPITETDARIAYCLKYVLSDSKGTYSPNGYPPFVRMSKGLGRNYINSETIEFHNRRVENCTVSLTDGKKLSLPKYFKERIYDDFSRYKLTLYLQQRADNELTKRVEQNKINTNMTEAEIYLALDSEPYLPKLDPRKSLIF